MSNSKRKYWALALIALLLLALSCGYVVSPPETREQINAKISSLTANAKNYIVGSYVYGKLTFAVRKAKDKIGKGGGGQGKDGKGAGDKAKTPSATLTGIIYDELKAPIADADVTVRELVKNKQFKGKTDKDGKYTIADMPSGNGNIVVQHPKFVAMVRPRFPLKLNETAKVDITLPFGAQLKGRVVDEEKKPIAAATVEARHISTAISASGGETAIFADVTKDAQSAKDGNFNLAAVPLGDVLFVASKVGYEQYSEKHTIERKSTEKTFEIILKRGGVLDGEVRDGDGKGLRDAKITLEKYKPFGSPAITLNGTSFTLQTKPDGKFRFEQLYNEGFYDLKVEHPEFAPTFMKLVPVGTEKMVISLSLGATITGNTILIDRTGNPGASVPVKIEAIIKETTFSKTLSSDSSGYFKFDKLPYGNYKIWVDDYPYASLERAPIPSDPNNPKTENVKLEVYQVCPVSGRVVSAEDGMPIAGATVTIDSIFGIGTQRTKRFTAKTGSIGKFVFDKLPGGQHTATADAKGYVRTTTGSSAETFFLLPGEAKSDIALQLYRGGTVEGRVYDANEQVIVGAEVQLFVASTNSRNIDASRLKGKTGDNGWYKISGIDVGDQLQLYATARATGHTKAMSLIIDLTSKQPTAIVDIHLPIGGAIQGRVMDEAGLPIQGAQLQWSSNNFPGDPSPSGDKLATESNGGYQIKNLPPGNIYLNVSRSGYVSQGRNVTVANNQVKAGQDFKLKTGRTINGFVQTAEGRPIPGANVRATGLSGTQGSDTANTDKEGKFELKNLGSGTFRLNATFNKETPEGNQSYNFYVYPIKSDSEGVLISCDVDNHASTTVDVAGSARKIQNFSFTLRSKSDTRGQDFSMTVSRSVANTNGLLKVSNIPLGVYTLEVRSEGFETWKNDRIYIGPNTKTTLPPVHLNASGGIHGKVVSNKTNRPINGVQVTVFELENVAKNTADSSQGWKRIAGASTSYTGEFRVTGLSPGTYRTDFSHANYTGESKKNVPVTRRQSYDLGTVVMESGGTVTGTVSDETGAPCQSFTITVTDVSPQRKVTTDRGGNYLIQGLSEGSHTITVQGAVRGWRPTYSFGNVLVIAGESVSKNFTVGLNANMAGYISAPNASTGTGQISIYPFDENSRVIDWIKYDANITNLNFALNQVPPGLYFLYGNGRTPSGNFKIWTEQILAPGDNPVQISLAPSTVGGQVFGATMPSVGALQNSVQLRPLFEAGHLSQTLYNLLLRNASPTTQGDFSFQYVQPGNYQILYKTTDNRWVAAPPLTVGYGQYLSGLALPLD